MGLCKRPYEFTEHGAIMASVERTIATVSYGG
jgi:hypothetical protein